MPFAANNNAALKRAGGLLGGDGGGLLGGGLLGGGNDQGHNGDSNSATPTDPLGGGLGGGGLGPIPSLSIPGVSIPSITTSGITSSSTATETPSVTPSSTPSVTATLSSSLSLSSTSSATVSSSQTSSLSSTVSLSSSATSSVASTPTSTIPSATTPAPTVIVSTQGAGVITVTSHVPAAAAASGSPSASAAPVGFLQNKGAVAGTFTVVGIIALILVFIASTWCIRRNKHNRLLKEAVDWSPSTHLTGAAADSEKGYPVSLHRTNSGLSTNSRPGARYPAPSAYRDGPPLPSQVVYGNMGAGTGATNPGYYEKPMPAVPGQMMQYGAPAQAPMQPPYGASVYNQNQYGAADYNNQYPTTYGPPASLQPAQNPYNNTNNGAAATLVPPAAPYNRAHARTPSPTDSDMAYLGYLNDPGAPVQIGRKVSLTKATATTVKHRPGQGQASSPSAEGLLDAESNSSHGSTSQPALKVVNE